MVDWLKLLHTFPRNPKLRLLARSLKCHKLTAQGLAVQWLIFIDEQTTDGCTHLTEKEVDEELGYKGGAAALCAIGWARLDEEKCLVANEFGKHCGESAKGRAETSRRVAAHRQRVKCNAKNVTDVTQEGGEGNGENVTSVTEKPWIEKEEEFTNNTSAQNKAVSISARADFRAWLGELAPCHPGLEKCRVLPNDVVDAAAAAFDRLPLAKDFAPMLRDYMRDRMQLDSYRKPFFRPERGSLFFEAMERVLVNAERWQRETGWKPRKAASADRTDAQPAPAGRESTEEERAEFLRCLHNIMDGKEGEQ